jgi:hypothetical protein
LDHLKKGDLESLKHERPSGPSHGVVGSGDAPSLDSWLLNMKAMFEGILGRYLKGVKRRMSVRGNVLTQEA